MVVQHAKLAANKMPKATKKTVMEEEVSEGETEEEDTKETGPHGTTNPVEAQRHIHALDDAMEKLEESIREGVAEDIMKKTLE